MPNEFDNPIHDITDDCFDRLDEALQLVVWSLRHQSPEQAAATYQEIWRGINSQFYERYFDEGVFEAILMREWSAFPSLFAEAFFDQTSLRVDQLIALIVKSSTRVKLNTPSLHQPMTEIIRHLEAKEFHALNQPLKTDLLPFMILFNRQIHDHQYIAKDYITPDHPQVLNQLHTLWGSEDSKVQAVLSILKGTTTVEAYAKTHGYSVHQINRWLDTFIKKGSEAIVALDFEDPMAEFFEDPIGDLGKNNTH